MAKKNKYECSIHGNEGNIKCDECCRNLKRLIQDNNCHLSGDPEIKKRILNA